MADIRTLFDGFTLEQKQAAIQILDAVSRPLTVREIEGAMIGKGVSRTQRKILSKSIERLHIIALVGPEHG
jgi:predicted RNA binding protein with dsRBD fold (UPF0201 family)